LSRLKNSVTEDVGDFVPLQYRTILGDFGPHTYTI